uniref:uncharacterized protein LOC113474605 n=1 Tax=Ciona intestinalis TaxID=7719 RepID=UPI000EF4F453|nr:uncharacterized protein LOC113474605 [Ciona intestinalis]|eukprot:XP_026692152.1 uncharacterized protein LOC113474605 [Ciona intestinalis]
MINTRKYVIGFGSVVTFLFLTISLFSDHWLNQRAAWTVSIHAAGLMFRSSPEVVKKSEVVKKEMYSYSGLWRICCGEAMCAGRCKILDSLTSEVESRTISSIYVINMLRRSNMFPILSVFLTFFATVLLGFSYIWAPKKLIFPLIAGVFFVLSGLSNVLGIIIYISSSDKLSKEKTPDTYYGWSFYFAGFAFLLAEILGVMVIQDIVKMISNNEQEEGEDNDDEEGDNEDEKGRRGSSTSRRSYTDPSSLRRSYRRASVKRMDETNITVDTKLINQLQRLHRKLIKDFPEDEETSQQNNSPEKTAEARPRSAEDTPGLPYSDSGYHDMSSNDARLEGPSVPTSYMDRLASVQIPTRSGSLDQLTGVSMAAKPNQSRRAERYSDHVISYKTRKKLAKQENNWSVENTDSGSKDELYSTENFLHQLPPPADFTTTDDGGILDENAYGKFLKSESCDDFLFEQRNKREQETRAEDGRANFTIRDGGINAKHKLWAKKNGPMKNVARSGHSRFLHQFDKSGNIFTSADSTESSPTAIANNSNQGELRRNGYLRKMKANVLTPSKLVSVGEVGCRTPQMKKTQNDIKSRAGKAKKRWPITRHNSQSIDIPVVGSSIDEGTFSDLADCANHLDSKLHLPVPAVQHSFGSSEQLYFESRSPRLQHRGHTDRLDKQLNQNKRNRVIPYLTKSSTLSNSHCQPQNGLMSVMRASSTHSINQSDQPPPYHNVHHTIGRYQSIPMTELSKSTENGIWLPSGGFTEL